MENFDTKFEPQGCFLLDHVEAYPGTTRKIKNALDTYPKNGLEKSNGDMTLISPDAGMRPLRRGTEPGTAPSLMRLIKPIIARRPLLISILSLLAFHSSLLLLLKPKGSYRFRGTG